MTDIDREIHDCGQELFAALYELGAGKYYSVIFEWRSMMHCFYFKVYRGKYKIDIRSKSNLEMEFLISYKSDGSSQSQKTLDFFVCSFLNDDELSYSAILEKIKYMTTHRPPKKKTQKKSDKFL